jgi:hypothetical protein
MTVVIVLYALAVLVFFNEHTKKFMASPAQLGTTALIALALAVAAFAMPRRPASSPGWVPPPWLVGCGAVVLLGTHQLAPPSWPGVALDALTLALPAALLLLWSGRARWGGEHVLAAGGAALVVNAALSFVVEPLGNTSYVFKYAANTVLMLGVLALLVWAHHRLHRAEATAQAESAGGTYGEPPAEPRPAPSNADEHVCGPAVSSCTRASPPSRPMSHGCSPSST